MTGADHQADALARAIMAAVRHPLVLLDGGLRVVFANPAFCQAFGVSAEQAAGRPLVEVGGGAWDVPAVRHLLERVLAENRSVDDVELTHDVPGAGRRTLLVSARPVRREGEPAHLILLAVEDVTAQRQARERYRAISELISDYAYAFRVRPDGTLQGEWVTDSFVRVFGFTPEELEARGGWTSVVHPEDLPRALQHARTVAGGQAEVCELRFVARSGEVRWLRDHAVPVRDEGGRVVRIYGAAQDITASRQAEAALAEREARFRRLADTTPTAVVVFDPGQMRFVYANRAAEVVSGYTRDELLALSLQRLVHPDSWETVRTLLQAARRGEAASDRHEVAIRRKDGVRRVLDVTTSEIEWEGRRAVLTTGLDITERTLVEEARRRRLAELEALHRISIALRGAQTVEEALPVLLDETLAALDTNSGSIVLYDPARGYLRPAADRGWFADLTRPFLRPGEGIVGTVFATGRPHRSPEFAADPLARPAGVTQVPRGWGGACVPIRTASEVVGVLCVAVPHPREIAPEEMTLLQSLAEMAGTALHRLRLHQEALRRVRHLQALQTVDRAITASLDLRLTLGILLDQAIAQLGLDAAGVLLAHPHLQVLEHAASRGFRTQIYSGGRLRMGEGVAGQAARERRTVVVASPGEAPEFTRQALLEPEGFLTHIAVPLVAKGQVVGVLEGFHRRPFQPDREWVDLLEALAQPAAIAVDNARLFDALQRSHLELSVAYDATIEALVRALDVRDRETQDHTRRVTEMMVHLARLLGVPEEDLVHVRRGALLHDIGKIGVPDAILLKPGPLTGEEWAIMKQHPLLAYEMLQPIAFLRPALDIPYCRHERWDGRGYPRGLRGEQIPLAARIFAVVDVFDALTSDRPYRRAWSREDALAYIRRNAGAQFDPAVVEVFLREVERKAIPRE